MHSLLNALRRIERWASAAAMTVLVAIMLIVVADVFLRYAFHRPLAWTYDFISLYLMAALFYFALPVSYESKSLVSIDMLYERFSPRGKLLANLATNLSAVMVFALIAYASGGRAFEEFIFDDVAGGVIPWPAWVSTAIVAAGALLLALRMTVEILFAMAELGGAKVPPASTAPGHPHATPSHTAGSNAS